MACRLQLVPVAGYDEKFFVSSIWKLPVYDRMGGYSKLNLRTVVVIRLTGTGLEQINFCVSPFPNGKVTPALWL